MISVSGHDSPECVIYCNSQFITIKQWLDAVNKLGGSIDLEKDARNELRIDVSFTRAKLFQSLIKNVPKMFPKEMLDIEFVNEEGSQEIYLVVKKTNDQIKMKKEFVW